MEKRYTALRIIATVYKVLGGIVLVLAILGAAGACLGSALGGEALRSMNQFGNGELTGMGLIGGILAGLGILIGGGVGGLTLFATGEAIYLLINIEENTRRTAMKP